MMAQKDLKELAKSKIKEKIATYEALKKSGRYGQIGESETCTKFILPLFEALGWDTTGEHILDEVTEQEAAGGLKRVDYAFNVNSSPVMFLEAKALSEDLEDPKFARQAINYGYAKSVKWVILSDFEGIIVFNSLLKTKRNSERTVLKISYTEYLDKFDELWLLSKESIVNGELDKHARTKGHIVNKVPINEILLTKLLVWRNLLIKRIASDNASLSKEDVAECVQRLLNRMIFIRTCEDRSIEKANLLKNLRKEWQNDQDKRLNNMLRQVFRDFDDGYNSNLFAKHLVDTIKISDDLLDDVIGSIYEDAKEDVEFDFAIIDADILGSIYEQYLGTIQKGESAQDKEKRKSHGIYYTPKYIVDYIAKNTLGKILEDLLQNKEYAKIGKLKVLDPACGSGSFLLKTLELFDDAYGKTPEFTKFPKGRKIKALCNNIYGVDLDSEAVELTKLNLLLSSTYSRKKLPDLGHNIEQGNSLIDDSKIAGDNAFDWNKRFKDVMDQGGFDVIVGNPPYIKEDVNKFAFNGLHDSPYYQGKMDIWTLFACKAIDLLKEGGYFSFIAPNSWVASYGASIFREKILSCGEIVTFIDFSDYKVFEEASIQTMIFVFQKKKPKTHYKVQNIKIENSKIKEDDMAKLLKSKMTVSVEGVKIFSSEIKPVEMMKGTISFLSDENSGLIEKIQNKANYKMNEDDVGNGIDVLQDFVNEKHLDKLKGVHIKKGDGVLVLGNGFVSKMSLNKKEAAYLKPYYYPKQINRYLSLKDSSEYRIIYADKYFREHISEFPNLKQHIDKFKPILTSAFAPYGLHRPRDERFFVGEGIFLLRKTMDPAFTYVDFPCYVTRAYLILKPKSIDLKYLTGILNSKLMFYWLKNIGKRQGEQLQIDKEPILKAPIYVASQAEQKSLIKLVNKMLDLNSKYAAIKDKLTSETERLKRQIDEMDQEIDSVVYKIYGLTEEEIKVVEGNG